MKNNRPLDAECILIIGGEPATARAIACNLAVNGAIVFVSGDSEKTLTGHLDHIRAKVPGCSVTGTPGNTSSAVGIRNFLLQAEIALPMQGAVIHLPVFGDNGAPVGDLLLAGQRLFKSMADHGGGQVINVSECDATGRHVKKLSDNQHRNLAHLGIKITSVVTEQPEPVAVADAVLHVLCQPGSCEIRDVRVKASAFQIQKNQLI
jgi:hypothetical protein